MKLLYTMTISLVFAVGAGVVLTQDFQKGMAAAQAGDFATALNGWRPLAEQGDADAQNNLGWMYSSGEGVLQDYAEAVKWYRLAAEQEHAQAQYSLGVIYKNGNGVLQDDVRAHMWHNLASANGHKDAGKRRDETAEKMTAAAIFEAQKMARECMSSNYQNCGW